MLGFANPSAVTTMLRVFAHTQCQAQGFRALVRLYDVMRLSHCRSEMMGEYILRSAALDFVHYLLSIFKEKEEGVKLTAQVGEHRS